MQWCRWLVITQNFWSVVILVSHFPIRPVCNSFVLKMLKPLWWQLYNQSVSQSIKKIHCAYPFPPCLASIKFKDRFSKLSKAYWVFFPYINFYNLWKSRFVLQYFQVQFFIYHFWSIFVIFKEYEKLRKYTHTSASNKKTTKTTSLDSGNCPITVLNEGRFTNQYCLRPLWENWRNWL